VRRSRLDVRLGRELRVGQLWRRRHGDPRPWRVRQLHRADCVVELEAGASGLGVVRTLSFAELRQEWQRLPPATPIAASGDQLAFQETAA
jgi:hypothetical protein